VITSLLHTITDFSSSRRGKFVVIVLWLLVAVALIATAPKLVSLYDNSIQQRIPAGADSQVAQNLLLREFPANRGTPALLVFYDRAGLSVDDRIRIRQVNDWLTTQKTMPVASVVSPFTVPQATTQLISSDGTTMTMIATLSSSATDPATLKSVTIIRSYLQDVTAGNSLQANLTGPAGILSDATAIFGSVDVRLLLVTISLVFVLLIVLYRSPILALLPLLGVGIAMQVVDALLGFGAKAGLFAVGSMTSQIATVLLFGAGTDYSIFIASRFREELTHTQDKHQAMHKTMRAVGEAITSSAMTVILALLTLLFAALGLYSSLGPTLAIAIAVMLLTGLTLVPALITWLGRAAYWPFVPRYQAQQLAAEATPARGFWGRLGQWTVRHRVAAVVCSALLLVVLALGNLGSEPSFNFLTAFRVPTDSSRGYALLQQHFPAGTLAPTTVLIQFHGATPDAYQHLVQLDAITTALQKVPGVAEVRGPTRPTGSSPAIDPATLQANIAALPASLRAAIRDGQGLPACSGSPCTSRNPNSLAAIGTYAASTSFVASDATTVQLSVIFQDDPYSLAAIQRIPLLRKTVNRALAANGLGAGAATSASFHIAGQTAQLADQLAYNQRDTLLIVPAVLVLVLLVLALLLRSLAAPLYLLGAVTLNFLAAMGVCSFFFQRVQGQDGFNYAIPLYTFVFLVALGADYTIFLMSRVREEVEQRGLEAGVAFAVSRTGSVITSAGLILAGTFLVLTTLPLTILYQLGVCVAVGVLLDTFVVRGLLVPGMVALLGRWNWWPLRMPTQAKLALLLLLALSGTTFVSCAGGGGVPASQTTARVISTCGGGACSRLTPAGRSSIPVIPITAVDYGYEMPTSINLRAGLVDIALVNNGTQPHQAQLARLNKGVTPNQVLDEFVTRRDQSAGFALLTLAGGSDIVAPGYGQETILNLPAGEYVLLCLVVGDDGVPHVYKGMIHFFTVKAATAQVTPPASDGEVVMGDSGYVLPSVIKSAQALTLRVSNQGSEPHEMNIVRLAPGKSVQDILAFFRSPSGPPPFEEYGGMAALAPGGSGWVRLHLGSGNYALCSLIPDQKTGQPQLAQGMVAPFTVD
jgi:RND superfamily putative drug exporter